MNRDTKSEAAVNRAIAEQAQAWFVANRDRELTLEQRGEFLTWLRTSPRHVREYLAAAQFGSDLRGALHSYAAGADELIAAARAESDNVVSLETTLPTVAASPASSRRIAYATAASLALLAIGGWIAMQLGAPHREYRTVHGEQRTVRLDDGSVLHLNSDSVVRIDYSKSERGIVLERGQALFKVAKDSTRPFRVRVAGTEVVAVGTEFDVRRHANKNSDDVVVTVVEGIVTVANARVRAADNTEKSAIKIAMVAPVRLGAGQQVRITRQTEPMVGHDAAQRDLQVRAVDIRPAVAWVQQQVMFERETLDAVVKEFNRYGAMPMVIEDRDLAGLRISGVFNAYDLESFVGYLEQVNGIAVRRDVDRIRISMIKNDGETL